MIVTEYKTEEKKEEESRKREEKGGERNLFSPCLRRELKVIEALADRC